jgi:hypothetical protein
MSPLTSAGAEAVVEPNSETGAIRMAPVLEA